MAVVRGTRLQGVRDVVAAEALRARRVHVLAAAELPAACAVLGAGAHEVLGVAADGGVAAQHALGRDPVLNAGLVNAAAAAAGVEVSDPMDWC